MSQIMRLLDLGGADEPDATSLALVPGNDRAMRPSTSVADPEMTKERPSQDTGRNMVIDAPDPPTDEWIGSAVAKQVYGTKQRRPRGTFVPHWVLYALDNCADALVASQILYWFANDKRGKPRAQIRKGGYRWIAKSHAELGDETGLKPSRIKASLNRLEKTGLIERRYYRFNSVPTTHIRLVPKIVGKYYRQGRDRVPDAEGLD
jgi:hypothetical protein